MYSKDEYQEYKSDCSFAFTVHNGCSTEQKKRRARLGPHLSLEGAIHIHYVHKSNLKPFFFSSSAIDSWLRSENYALDHYLLCTVLCWIKNNLFHQKISPHPIKVQRDTYLCSRMYLFFE